MIVFILMMLKGVRMQRRKRADSWTLRVGQCYQHGSRIRDRVKLRFINLFVSVAVLKGSMSLILSIIPIIKSEGLEIICQRFSICSVLSPALFNVTHLPWFKTDYSHPPSIAYSSSASASPEYSRDLLASS